MRTYVEDVLDQLTAMMYLHVLTGVTQILLDFHHRINSGLLNFLSQICPDRVSSDQRR